MVTTTYVCAINRAEAKAEEEEEKEDVPVETVVWQRTVVVRCVADILVSLGNFSRKTAGEP